MNRLNFLFIFVFILNLLNLTLKYKLYPITIQGNNLIWSTDDNSEFICAFNEKLEGKKIWKLYNINENLNLTILRNIDLQPKWSKSGKKIVATEKNNIYILTSPVDKINLKTITENILHFDINNLENKILYSDRLKIYLLDINENKNSFVTYGQYPFYINNDKNIIFLNENNKLSMLDNELNSKIIIDDYVNKYLPFKDKNGFIFQDNELNKLKLFDLDFNKIITIIDEDNEITDFSVSQDENFVIYIVNNSKLFIAHIPTKLKVLILSNNNIFSPAMSKDNKYYSYEKNEKIFIDYAEKFINAFELDKIFKINIGSKHGLTLQDKVEVYEERRNLEGKIIGMDYNKFKGVLKILAIYDDYSFAKLDEEFKTNFKIELDDIAYFKANDVMGIISK